MPPKKHIIIIGVLCVIALGLGYVPVIGLAKRLEEVFKPEMSEPQNISKTSAGLHLLRTIRDEVHRYAIAIDGPASLIV